MEKEGVCALLLEVNYWGEPFLSTLDFARQKEVVIWNQKATSQVGHKLSSELLQWILQQVEEGNFDKVELASSVCHKSADQRPTLTSLEEEAQKKLALLNKDKTILILPWLSSNLQKWIYQEAQEGRFDQDEVCKVLKKEEKEGEEVLSSKIHPGWLNSKDLHFQ